jgi:hypothetical protein
MQAPPKVEVVPGAPCEHPPAKRREMATGGKLNQFLCTACASIIDPDAAVPDGA